MQNTPFEEIYEKLKNSKRVLLSLHVGPDGDSLSSCVSMKYFLERDFGASVKIISRDELEETLMDLSWAKEVEFGVDVNKIDFSEFDIFVTLDSAEMFLANFNEENKEKISIINMDHHDTNPYYGNLNYINPESAACASLLKEFFKRTNVEFDSELSTRLLLGVCTDSDFFSGMNSESAIKDASFLIDEGGKYVETILKKFQYKEPLKMKKLSAIMIENLKFENFGGKKVAYSLLTNEKMKELGLNFAEVRKGILSLKGIGGADLVFTISDMGGKKQKLSFRSNLDISAAEIAKKLGGGGHKNVAATIMDNYTLEEARDKTLNVIREEFE